MELRSILPLTDAGAEPARLEKSRETSMRRALRLFLRGLVVVVAAGGALFIYFLYTPRPEVPRLSGRLSDDAIQVGGLKRTYRTYMPQGLTKG